MKIGDEVYHKNNSFVKGKIIEINVKIDDDDDFVNIEVQHKIGKSKRLYHKKDLMLVNNIENPLVCNCSINTLMLAGCKCGSIVRYKV